MNHLNIILLSSWKWHLLTIIRRTGECFEKRGQSEKQEHDFKARGQFLVWSSIRKLLCGAKRQGRIRLKGTNLQILLSRCIVEIDSPYLVNFYISIKHILWVVFLYIIGLIKIINSVYLFIYKWIELIWLPYLHVTGPSIAHMRG
jgi:hypothetical protein